MQGYTQYLQNHYTEAIGTLDRFIQLHPAHRDIAYAYYLRALCYYEQIADIQRDQKGTELAMAALQEVVNRFPDSAYARDARLKIDLCRDHLAGKEMEVGRWYEKPASLRGGDWPLPARGGRLPDHQPRAGGVAPADRDLSDARSAGPGEEDRLGAGIQLSRQPMVPGQLQPAPRCRPGAAPGQRANPRNRRASSPAPGTRSSDRDGSGSRPDAHRAVHPRRGADRAAGPDLRPGPHRAHRRDWRRQVDPAG